MPDDIAEIKHPAFAVVAIVMIAIVVLSVVLTYVVNKDDAESDSPPPFPESESDVVVASEPAGDAPPLLPT
jgi:hypothetical protein